MSAPHIGPHYGFPLVSVTDAGLVALAKLRKLEGVYVCGSEDVTKAGVMALALNWLVDAIHMLCCSRFKWPDAKYVMNMVKRPYLEIKVT